MENSGSRLQSTTNQKAQAQSQQVSGQVQVHEFATADDLLKADFVQTVPPAEIPNRIAETLKADAPTGSWWRRWLGR